jgi:Ribonuclease G/E
VKKVGPDLDGLGVLLRVNPDIARALKDEERGVLRDLKQMLGKDVIVKADVQLHHEQFDVMSIGG